MIPFEVAILGTGLLMKIDTVGDFSGTIMKVGWCVITIEPYGLASVHFHTQIDLVLLKWEKNK